MTAFGCLARMDEAGQVGGHVRQGLTFVCVPGLAFVGAGLLAATMVGAALTHLFILGPSLLPALALGLLAGYAAWSARRFRRAVCLKGGWL